MIAHKVPTRSQRPPPGRHFKARWYPRGGCAEFHDESQQYGEGIPYLRELMGLAKHGRKDFRCRNMTGSGLCVTWTHFSQLLPVTTPGPLLFLSCRMGWQSKRPACRSLAKFATTSRLAFPN